MISRRDVLKQGLAAGLWASFAAPLRAAATSDLWLNRLTFGATPDSRASLAEMGAEAWLDGQLASPPDDADLTARLVAQRLRISYPAGNDGAGHWKARDQLRPLAALTAAPDSVLPLLDWTKAMDFSERIRPAEEVIAASLTRAVHAQAQLREVMTQFWHDHFNVQSQKDEFTAVFFPAHDAELRTHALGRFRDLLGAVARSPSMLCYLNNADSRASPANENYARELLELHTLGAGNYLNDRFPHWHQVPVTEGVAVGYIDEDVYEVARALTGWTVGDGRWIAEGVDAPKTGVFHYAEAWHDPYQKRILAVEFPPNRAAMADGEEVLDLLARHPGTARFICTKIARRLLADQPDAGLIDRLTQVFLARQDAPDQIAQVIRALTRDPAFAAPPTKLRRPFEFLAALYRATGAEITGTENGWTWQLLRAGWHQHTFPPPTGHSDLTEDWQSTTTLLRLVDYALYAHDEGFGATASRLDAPGKTLDDLARHWAERLTGSPQTDVLALVGADPSEPLGADRHDQSVVAVAFAALTPAFLFR